MRQDLKFFTDRIGIKVHRSSDVFVTGEVLITDQTHAKGLHDSQDNGCVFSISAKLSVIRQHIALKFDGRTIKCADQMEVLTRIRTMNLVLENPLEMPEIYRDMYVKIIDQRKANSR